MSKKQELIKKLCRRPHPKNFTIRDLDSLMAGCNCTKHTGGRGSGVIYVHEETKRVLLFDVHHPGKELFKYQIEKTIKFLKDIGEIE